MLLRILQSVCIVCLAVFMNGCASVYRVALSPEASSQLNSSNTSGVIAVEKDEIGTSINASNMTGAMGGGLVWAIVDSVANNKSSKNAEAAAADIRNGLLDYTFDQALTNAFSRRFASAGGGAPALSAVVISKNTAVPEIGRLVSEAQGDAVAVVFVRHLMTPDFDDVALVVEAAVCAKSEALRGIATMKSYAQQEVPVLYRNRIQTFWPLPATDRPAKSTRESNATAWVNNNAGSLRAALDAAAGEVADVIYWDLGEPAQESYDKGAPGGEEWVQSRDFSRNAAAVARGKVYRRESSRVWLRAPDGSVYAQPE